MSINLTLFIFMVSQLMVGENSLGTENDVRDPVRLTMGDIQTLRKLRHVLNHHDLVNELSSEGQKILFGRDALALKAECVVILPNGSWFWWEKNAHTPDNDFGKPEDAGIIYRVLRDPNYRFKATYLLPKRVAQSRFGSDAVGMGCICDLQGKKQCDCQRVTKTLGHDVVFVFGQDSGGWTDDGGGDVQFRGPDILQWIHLFGHIGEYRAKCEFDSIVVGTNAEGHRAMSRVNPLSMLVAQSSVPVGAAIYPDCRFKKCTSDRSYTLNGSNMACWLSQYGCEEFERQRRCPSEICHLMQFDWYTCWETNFTGVETGELFPGAVYDSTTLWIRNTHRNCGGNGQETIPGLFFTTPAISQWQQCLWRGFR